MAETHRKRDGDGGGGKGSERRVTGRPSIVSSGNPTHESPTSHVRHPQSFQKRLGSTELSSGISRGQVRFAFCGYICYRSVERHKLTPTKKESDTRSREEEKRKEKSS